MKKRLFTAVAFICFVFLLASCDDNNKNIESSITGNTVPATTNTIELKETYNVSFDSNGGSSVVSQEVEDGKKINKPSDPTKEGYTFDNWYYQNKVWDFNEDVVNGDIILTAKWNVNYYNLNLNVNDNKYGTVSYDYSGVYNYNSHEVAYGTSVRIDANTNPGYTFVGWYEGDNLVSNKPSYEFNMPANELSYTAKWIPSTNIKYKVEHYLEDIDGSYPDTPNDVDNLTGTTDTLTNAEVKKYEGFTSPEVAQVNINKDNSTVIKLYYTRNSYEVSLSLNNSNAGAVSGSGIYKYGKVVTIEAKPNSGYTFVGWYNGNNEISTDSSYTFTMSNKKISYTAKFSANTNTKYKVEHYLENLDGTYPDTPSDVDNLTGTTGELTNAEAKSYDGFTSPTITQVNINGDESTVVKLYYERISYEVKANISKAAGITGAGSHKYGEDVNIVITPYLGYVYEGIYINDTFVTKELSYEIDNISSDVEIRFKVLEELANFTFESTENTLTITGIVDKTVTEIEVPDIVTNISQGAFSECTSLETITLPFVGGSKTTYNYLGYIFGSSSPTFNSSYVPLSLNTVILSNECTIIERNAFYNCDSLTNVVISSSVTSIGKEAFDGCESLNNILIPSGVESIEELAFFGCKALTSITIPDSVTSIGEYAFYKCSSLESITLPFVGQSKKTNKFLGILFGAKTYLDNSKRVPKSLKTVTLGNGCTIIGNNAFYGCSSIESVIIPNSVESIDSEAFKECTSLKNIVIPSSVESIGSEAFENCKSLTSIIIPASIDELDLSIFSGCSSLANIVIPNSVESISDLAFKDCTSLTNVYFDGTKEEWNNIYFEDEYSNPMKYASNLYILDANGTVEYNGNKYSKA